MAQTLRTITLSAGDKTILLAKPLVLCRIFFSIRALADQDKWYQSKISFDDPSFTSFYVLNGPARYFSAEGEDVFQGNIWVYNASNVNLLFSSTEILCQFY